MFYKSVFLLIGALFLVQISAQTSSIEEAKSELSRLRETINTFLNQAFSTYTDWAEKADSLALETKSNGSQVIQSYADQYLQRFEDAKKSALQTQIDITVCLVYIGNQLEDLGSENIDGLITCVNDQIDQAIEYIRSRSMRTIDIGLNFIFEDERRMVHCGQSDGICLHDVVRNLLTDIESAPWNLGSMIDKDAYFFEAYLDRIRQSCGYRFTSTAILKGQSLAESFEQCVDWHINNS